MIPSLPKLLGLIAVIWVVWTGFRIYESRKAELSGKDDQRNKPGASGNGGAAQESFDANNSVELRECKICGTFYSGDDCGQENCRPSS